MKRNFSLSRLIRSSRKRLSCLRPSSSFPSVPLRSTRDPVTLWLFACRHFFLPLVNPICTGHSVCAAHFIMHLRDRARSPQSDLPSAVGPRWPHGKIPGESRAGACVACRGSSSCREWNAVIYQRLCSLFRGGTRTAAASLAPRSPLSIRKGGVCVCVCNLACSVESDAATLLFLRPILWRFP